MKKKSVVWQFFTKEIDDEGSVRVLCKLCDVAPKHHGNTTNLRGHLMRNHPIQWELAVEGVLHDESIRKTLMQETKIKNDDSETEVEECEVVEEVDDNVEWLETQEPNEIFVSSLGNLKRKFKNERSKPVRRSKRTYRYQDQSPEESIVQSPIKDQHTAFGDYVASKLRTFDSKTVSNVQQLISTILWQAESGYHQNTNMVKKLIINTFMQTEESSNSNDPVENNDETVYVTVGNEDVPNE